MKTKWFKKPENILISCDSFNLRTLEVTDKLSLAKYANNYKIWRNLKDGFPYPYSIQDAEEYILINKMDSPAKNLCIDYNGECIGIVGFTTQSDIYKKTVVFGYWLGEPFWGKGIMTIAVQKAIEYIFKNFDIERIHTGVMEHNTASMRVLEKAGFKFECKFEKSIFKDEKLWDEFRYSLLRESLKS